MPISMSLVVPASVVVVVLRTLKLPLIVPTPSITKLAELISTSWRWIPSVN
jgi:hypothetical protein